LVANLSSRRDLEFRGNHQPPSLVLRRRLIQRRLHKSGTNQTLAYALLCWHNPKKLLVRTPIRSHPCCQMVFLLTNCVATNAEPVIFIQMCTNCPTRPLVCSPT
jgi:hypothetical protein